MRILFESEFLSPLSRVVLTRGEHRSVGEHVVRFVASRSLRNWGAAMVALCAGVLLSPRPSEAGCGDYVWIRGRPVPMVHSMPTADESDGTADDGTVDDGSCGRRGRPRLASSTLSGSGLFGRLISATGAGPWRRRLTSIDGPWHPATRFQTLICCDNMLAEPFDLVADGFRLSILRPPR